MRATIKMKLGATFAFIVFFLLVVVGLGIAKLSTLNDTTTQMVAGPASRLERAGCACYNICMNKPLKLIKIGNSTGIILPKDVLARMNLGQGDEIYLSEDADGRLSLDRYDAEFARQMEMADQIMREDRDILRVLAK